MASDLVKATAMPGNSKQGKMHSPGMRIACVVDITKRHIRTSLAKASTSKTSAEEAGIAGD
jgi:hypothetical protein